MNVRHWVNGPLRRKGVTFRILIIPTKADSCAKGELGDFIIPKSIHLVEERRARAGWLGGALKFPTHSVFTFAKRGSLKIRRCVLLYRGIRKLFLFSRNYNARPNTLPVSRTREVIPNITPNDLMPNYYISSVVYRNSEVPRMSILTKF